MTAFWRVFDRLLRLVVVVIYVILTILAFSQVTVRYVLGGSITWSEEAVRFLFIWLAFIGAAITMEREGHVGVTVLVDLFPAPVRRAFLFFSDAAVFGFAIFFAVQGLNVSRATVGNLSPAMQISMGQVYLILPIAGILLAINALRVGHRHLTARLSSDVKEVL